MCPIIAKLYSVSPRGVGVDYFVGGRVGRFRESFANKRGNSFLHRRNTHKNCRRVHMCACVCVFVCECICLSVCVTCISMHLGIDVQVYVRIDNAHSHARAHTTSTCKCFYFNRGEYESTDSDASANGAVGEKNGLHSADGCACKGTKILTQMQPFIAGSVQEFQARVIALKL
jgi:hypothetical protein